MSDKTEDFSRRDFIKTAGATGLGSALIPFGALALSHGSAFAAVPEQRVVPTRPFGKTGMNVSILSLGGVLRPSDQIVFKMAFKMGVTYWDTADSYGWGKNEKAIGKYFATYPNHRKKGFSGYESGHFRSGNTNRKTRPVSSKNEYIIRGYVSDSLRQ